MMMYPNEEIREGNRLIATFMGICLYDQQFQWAEKPFQYHNSSDGLFPEIDRLLATGNGSFRIHKQGSGEWSAIIEEGGVVFRSDHVLAPRAVFEVLVKCLKARNAKGGKRHGR